MANKKSKPEYTYSVYGTFTVPTDDGNSFVEKLDKSFWNSVEEHQTGLPGAIGCYIFGIKTAGGPSIIPWYVGKTTNSFRAECSQGDKINKYNQALLKYKKRKPFLFFIPKVTSSEKFSTSSTQGDIEFLEKYLIAVALDANPNLLNVRGAKMYEKLYVPGVLNSKPGNSTIAVKALKDCLKLN